MSQPGRRIGADAAVGIPDLVAAAAQGDGRAWEAIVRRFSDLVWSVARAHDLSSADAAAVNGAVWRRLAAQLDDIDQPDRLGAWLASVARKECVKMLAEMAGVSVATREIGSDRHQGDDIPPIWRAVDTLPRHCRAVLRVAMADPHPSCREIAAALDLPVERVGRTRQQSIDHLRSIVAAF